MGDKRVVSITPPNRSWPRAELEEMVERWLQGNIDCEKAGDWTGLAQFYTENAVYSWNIGPNEEFVASGRAEIRDVAIGYQMKGFEAWEYPYHDIIIDEKRGTVVGFWKQRAPYQRPDGSYYEIAGIGGSWFEYGGNWQWQWQRDFFDLGNAKDCFFQLAGAGVLSPVVKEKIHQQAKGRLLPGHRRLHPEPSRLQKLRNTIAIARIALTGR
ncbi:nuclear transport factor 2 family protein [Oleomonas cavernae]|uniref:Nuclear transport factor 2 family protein n=1 Tax=Oleomonas cavernae TaxID=2320859 RepID=A0A418W902_9PROT|nr:nuclear transport factor 2 family protein [Oleomonas cavernae]RJF86511.1 nuclear transport factor 2 family protein [Oleomonas cavernae]